MSKNKEYENFDRTVRELLKVPHDDVKDKLDAEKAAKKKKKNATKTTKKNT